ncbi:efflux RND transporter periplasmic adaptor subunit [Comamonas testosteroni]|uniref:efflux RND transporter periplasmic adaptor subunit n=1 Tax=Comamonas testosteroni TaxID=285 RepID=UPI0002EA566B|nr:efflux RND transporter periplasmic adaptor subunit [Comamonas testosteroni]
MTENRRTIPWLLVAGVASAAAAIGFGAAQVGKPAATPVVAVATNPAPTSELEAPSGVVAIPDEYIKAAGIAVEAVTPGDVALEILAPATVAAAPGGEAVLVARATGTIQRVGRRLGDAVKAGDVLASVDSLDAAAMAADRRVAQAKAELARKSYARELELFQQGVTPRQEMEASKAGLDVAEAESLRATSVARAAQVSEDGRAVAVISPISGSVTAVNAVVGAYVAPNTELFRVAAPGALQIEAAVTPAEAGRISVGEQATIIPSSGNPIAAVVRSMTPTASSASRSATVVLTPSEPKVALVVGEGVQVRLHARSSGSAGLTVPENAVQNLDGRDVLFVKTDKGFRAQPVLVGARSGGIAQVISGVAAGDRVATRNAFLIKAEAKKNAGDDE